MVGGNMFSGLAEMVIAGMIAMAILFGFGVYKTLDYFFWEETYESKTILVPDVIVKSKTINGVMKSDTTYFYHLK